MPSAHMKKLFSIPAALMFVMFCFELQAQVLPVQVTPQLVPPYSVYLSDYASGGNEKLRVILLQRDLSRPSYQIRLVMNVEWNGKVIMRTSRSFNPPPLTLDPGIPMIISGAELSPYLDSRNIDFVGYDRNLYEKTRALPEGQYRISFTAYDYRRQDVRVSPEGNTFLYLSKSEPPLINYPACGTKLAAKDPQQIIFSWMPRNTSSPNSVMETEYEFSLYETRPAGRNPNDVVLTSQPIFRTRTNLTQLIFGPAEPILLRDMTYVWRVQAIDLNGRDAFRNNGYSEVCTFYYGGTDANFDIGVVKDLQAVGESKNRGKISWTTGFYDSYRVEYKKSGQGYEWFKSDTRTGELKLFDLEPDTEYEARVIAKKSGYYGPYSEIAKFRTLPNRVMQCGENPDLPDLENPGNPLTSLITGTVINARGSEMTILQVTQLDQPGWYKGFGQVTFDYFLGISYGVSFDRIFINENREVVLGRIDVMSEGMGELIKQQIEANKKPIVSNSSDPQWRDTEFHEKIFEYKEIEIENVTVDKDGNIIIEDSNGNTIPVPDIRPILVDAPEKAVIIEDKNGEQWVVQKDKETGSTKVTKIEGGGLPPASAIAINSSKTKILVAILGQFEEEIDAWIRINGKGGEDDPDVIVAEQLHEKFPKEGEFLSDLKEDVIMHYKSHPDELLEYIEENAVNRSVFDEAASKFEGDDEIDWTTLTEELQLKTRDITAEAIMELAGGELETEEITPECGLTHAGKEKPLGARTLIRYPSDCSYILSGVAVHFVRQGYGKYLCASERFNLIKCFSEGGILGDQEEAIIILLNETPIAHTVDLIKQLRENNTGVLSDINDDFQGDNYMEVFKAFQRLYLSATPRETIEAEVKKIDNALASDLSREEKAKQNYFSYFEGGVIKAIFADDFVFSRFDDVEIAKDGTVSFKFATDPRQHDETTTPITLKPFTLVGIKVRGGSNDVLETSRGSMVYVPAIMMPLLIKKRDNADFMEALNATAVATGVGSIITGTSRIVIVSGGIDLLLGGSALVVDNCKDDILKMQHGEEFLNTYVLINKAFLIYFGSRAIISLTTALPKLVSTFSVLRNSDDFAKLKITNPSKAAQIEREVDDLVQESREVIASAKTTELLTKIKYGADELSKMVQNFRKTSGKKNGNVAVIEYMDDAGKPKYEFGESTGIYNPHAEKAAWLKLEAKGVKPEQVTRIYTELEPCASRGRYCKNFINRTFPKANTYYSFDYLNGTTESCKASVKALGEEVNLLFK